jgi:hypothetical protein
LITPGLSGHAHTSRHSFAIELLFKGVLIKNVAKIWGMALACGSTALFGWLNTRQEAFSAKVVRQEVHLIASWRSDL